MILHAGLLALYNGGRWRGVLVEGASGAGKSDLALRALSEGFRLVADDRTVVWASGGSLFGRAPQALQGMIEARGLDVVRTGAIDQTRIDLVARAAAPEDVERIPERQVVDYAGLSVPLITLALLESSAPAKLRHALQHLGAGAEGAYQAHRVARLPTRPGGDSH